MEIRKIINDAIFNFYKPPKKYNRMGANDEYGDEVPSASFAKKSTMFSGGTKGANQSQMTDTMKGTKTGKNEEPEPVGPLKPTFDYGIQKADETAEFIWETRERLNQKTLEMSPPIDDKSSKGKKKKRAKQTEASAGRNDSQLLDMSGAASMSGATGVETMILN